MPAVSERVPGSNDCRVGLAASCSSQDPSTGRCDNDETKNPGSDDARPASLDSPIVRNPRLRFRGGSSMGTTRLVIPLYLIKSSVSLHFLKSLIEPNEKTDSSADVNRVVQRLAQPLEVIPVARGERGPSGRAWPSS